MNKIGKIDKTKAYRWRPSADLAKALEAAARDEKLSIDAILDRAVREWLSRHTPSQQAYDQAERQRLLHERARRAIGTVSVGGPSPTNAEVRKVMGEFLEAKHRASQRRAPRRAG